jgi:hypothetical protein
MTKLRYEVTALIGPCSQAEAEEFLERCAEDHRQLGAAWMMKVTEFALLLAALAELDQDEAPAWRGSIDA